MSLRRSAVVGIGVLGALTTATGIATAGGAFDGTDGAGTISSCYAVGQGNLRVIDSHSGESCRPNERHLTWSKNGATGQQAVLAKASNSSTVSAPIWTSQATGDFTP